MTLRRPLAILSLSLILVTCRDAFAPGDRPSGRIAVAPVLPSEAALASFGLTIDAVRFVVVRPEADTLADTTLALPPEATELALDLRVPLRSSPESLLISVLALSGTIPLFAGTEPVQVPTPLPPPEIEVSTYVGPSADSIVIQPRDPFILLGDSLRFQVQGFTGGVPVTQFYVAWSSGDSATAPINHFGVLTAPAKRGGVVIRARTPSGAADSTAVTFVPLPAQLVLAGGAGQSGIAGQPLETPLEVDVRGSDNLSVGGVSVRFRSLSGGTPADTTVVSDAAGRASVPAVLGPSAGPQSVEASLPALPGIAAVTFDLNATAGPISAVVVAPDSVLLDALGATQQFSAEAFDANGNPVATTFAWTTSDSGVATVGASGAVKAVGTGTAVITATAGSNGTAGGATLVVSQVVTQVDVIPDTISARIGDLLVFTATPRDQGGTTTPDTVHWAAEFPGTLTLVDTTSVFNQATVRLDGTGFGKANLLASAASATGAAQVFNPVQSVIVGLGGETNGIAVNDSTKLIYVAVDTGVVVLDQTDRPVNFVAVPEPLYYLNVDRTRNLIYAGARLSGTLYVIDGALNRVVRSFVVGRFFVPQFAVDEATGNILAPTTLCIGSPCTDIDFLGVFDPVLTEIVDTFAIGDQGVATAFDPVTRVVYAGVFAGPLDSIKVIDLGQRKVVDSIEVGSSLANLAIDPLTKRLYASDYVENAVYVIDVTTNQVRNRISVGLVPEGMAVDTVTKRLYVTGIEDRFVYVIDSEAAAVVQTIDIGGFASQVSVLQDANQVYVNTYQGKDVRVLKF